MARKLKRVRYVCPKCGFSTSYMYYEDEIKPEIECHCGAMMTVAPPRVSNHFHPSRAKSDE
jgi:Zn ribbon nucleic-acid-binding protein